MVVQIKCCAPFLAHREEHPEIVQHGEEQASIPFCTTWRSHKSPWSQWVSSYWTNTCLTRPSTIKAIPRKHQHLWRVNFSRALLILPPFLWAPFRNAIPKPKHMCYRESVEKKTGELLASGQIWDQELERAKGIMSLTSIIAHLGWSRMIGTSKMLSQKRHVMVKNE